MNISLEEHLQHLEQNEHFKCFLDEVWEIREKFVRDLADAEVSEIERLSGKIGALNEVLDTANYEARQRYVL